jgi:hypothetical protein
MAIGLSVGATEGLDPDAAAKAEAALKEALFRFARDFLAGGGTVSLDDWGAMSQETRTEFVRAGEFVRAHHHDLAAEAIVRAHAKAQDLMRAEALRREVMKG